MRAPGGGAAAAGAWQVGRGAWIYAKAWPRLSICSTGRGRARWPASATVKPWPWADTWPVARLRVPGHGVDLIVLDGVSGRTLAFGPGHARAPRGRARGHRVFSGHRDTHFRFLRRLAPGDEIVVETSEGRRRASPSARRWSWMRARP